jgi:NADH dehydrogenase [ubiquinone] 1 alpha subcomplex assembly factor 7
MNKLAEQATGLTGLLHRMIERDGPVTVAEYMALALGHPEYGYYQQAEPFGSSGDFVTAPEISQCFGELIGLWLAQYWRDCGSPTPFNLIELGPGRGTLMADALRAARLAPDFLAALNLHLVENSPRLRDVQRQRLEGQAPGPITWHDSIGTLPAGFSLIIANEFFDALPVRQFRFDGEHWQELRIGLATEGESLSFCLLPAPPGLETMLPLKRPAPPPGSIAEISPAGLAVMQGLGHHLGQHGGAALIIDYGYVAQQFSASQPWGETLQALKAHKHWPVLDAPGTADITAHVDFTMMTRAAQETGLRCSPVTAQGLFLERLGIRHRQAQLQQKARSAEQSGLIASSIERLVAGEAMGTLFKVLGVSHPSQPPMPALEQMPPHSEGP